MLFFFFFNDTATTEIYTTVHTLSLHDALPTSSRRRSRARTDCTNGTSRAATSGTRSEEHTSELQLRTVISYAVFCLKKKKKQDKNSYGLLSFIPNNYRNNKKKQ